MGHHYEDVFWGEGTLCIDEVSLARVTFRAIGRCRDQAIDAGYSCATGPGFQSVFAQFAAQLSESGSQRSASREIVR